MGKKQSAKLIKRFSQRQRVKGGAELSKAGGVGPGRKSGSGGGKKASGVKTLVARQLQAVKKRKRADKDDAGDDAKEAGPGKPKKFDVEAGQAAGGDAGTASKKAKGAMSIEDFLAGGFEDDNQDDEEDSDASSSSSSSSSASASASASSSGDGEEDKQASDASDDEEEDAVEHKKQLERLKEKDPEFYAHLQKEGKELLEFDDSGDSSSDQEDEEQDQVDDERVINMRKLKELETAAFKGGENKALKTMLALFHQVAMQNKLEEEKEEEAAGMGKSTAGQGHAAQKFVLKSDMVRERVVRSCMSNVAGALDAKLGVERKSTKMRLPKTLGKWATFEGVVRRFLQDMIRIVRESQDAGMQSFLLRSMAQYQIYVASSASKVQKPFLKTFVSQWGGSTTPEKVRLLSFARILEFASMVSRSALPEVLKAAYLEFVKGAKSSSEHEVDRISMQARCLVELFGIDLGVSYQLGFVYIRQLALHLRAAIISKSEESTRSVYSWQFVHCLRLWGIVLSAYPGKPSADEKKANISAEEQQLRSLIYPLVQVIIGTIKLAPSGRNFPVRFHLIGVLNRLERSSRYFCPVAPLLLDVIQAPQLADNKPSTAKPPALSKILRLNKQMLTTGVCHQALITRTVELLESHLENNRFSIGFPELAFPVTVALKAFSRKCRMGKSRALVKGLLAKVSKWSEFVKEKRASAPFNPANVKRMNQFLSDHEDASRASELAQADKLHQQRLLEQAREATLEADEEQDEPEEQDNEDESDDSDDDEEDQDDDKPQHDTAPPAKKRRKDSKGLMKELAGQDDDVVEDFVMSSSDESESDSE